MSKANIDGLRGGTEKASSRQEEGPPLHHTQCVLLTRACAGLFWCCLPPQVARLVCLEGRCEDVIPDGWCATSPFRGSIQFVPTALRSRDGRRPSRPAQQGDGDDAAEGVCDARVLQPLPRCRVGRRLLPPQ